MLGTSFLLIWAVLISSHFSKMRFVSQWSSVHIKENSTSSILKWKLQPFYSSVQYSRRLPKLVISKITQVDFLPREVVSYSKETQTPIAHEPEGIVHQRAWCCWTKNVLQVKCAKYIIQFVHIPWIQTYFFLTVPPASICLLHCPIHLPNFHNTQFTSSSSTPLAQFLQCICFFPSMSSPVQYLYLPCILPHLLSPCYPCPFTSSQAGKLFSKPLVLYFEPPFS